MIRDFVFAFFIFLILRFVLARSLAGNNVDLRKGTIYSFFYALTFVIITLGWNASYKARSGQPDTDKASR